MCFNITKVNVVVSTRALCRPMLMRHTWRMNSFLLCKPVQTQQVLCHPITHDIIVEKKKKHTHVTSHKW